MHFNQHIAKSLIMLLVGISGMSCHQASSNAGNLQTAEIQTEKETHLFQDKSKPASHLDVKFTYITDGKDVRMKDSLNRLLTEKALGEKYRLLPASEAVEQYATDYGKTYCNDLESTYLDDVKDVEEEVVKGWYSYEESIESAIERYDKNLLVYRVNTYDYTGGPHGIYGSLYTNIDLHTLRVIQLKDLFRPGYEAELTTLICQQLMKDVEVDNMEELQELGYGYMEAITPTENFIIQKDGILFVYNIYEIAPYALGITSVLVPYDALKPLLNIDYLIIKEQL